MIGEHQINRFGVYEFEESDAEPDYSSADRLQLAIDWNTHKANKNEYSRLRQQGLSHVKASFASFGKLVREDRYVH
jgi:hypothetical protein